MGATKAIPTDGLIQCLGDPLMESLPKPVRVLPSPEWSYNPPSVCSTYSHIHSSSSSQKPPWGHIKSQLRPLPASALGQPNPANPFLKLLPVHGLFCFDLQKY